MGTSNPNYGTGVFRRRLHWRATAGGVFVAMEDSNHGFRLQLAHDGQHITQIIAEPLRFPFTTCPEAVANIQALVGLELTAIAAQRAALPQATNCTHLIDMVLLAAVHAPDVGMDRLYEIAVTDEREGITQARITCDGQQMHDWAIRAHVIETPHVLAGRPVMRGFYAWVMDEMEGLPREAAQVLQRGYFVAQSRRWNTRPIEEHPASTDGISVGACYSYNTGTVDRALRINGSVRDCTAGAENLLKFLQMKPD
ncbi:MAG: DUF2889 domain-containing protein [Sterolibacterium sp.]|jgi:hypothetical protein|nr:DUF2889 domain-containing protein [Sterolibacterium sp.]